MHALIERKSRKKNIFSQKQWRNIMETAKNKNPYNVSELEQSNIFNFSALGEGMNWEKILISQLHEILL